MSTLLSRLLDRLSGPGFSTPPYVVHLPYGELLEMCQDHRNPDKRNPAVQVQVHNALVDLTRHEELHDGRAYHRYHVVCWPTKNTPDHDVAIIRVELLPQDKSVTVVSIPVTLKIERGAWSRFTMVCERRGTDAEERIAELIDADLHTRLARMALLDQDQDACPEE